MAVRLKEERKLQEKKHPLSLYSVVFVMVAWIMSEMKPCNHIMPQIWEQHVPSMLVARAKGELGGARTLW